MHAGNLPDGEKSGLISYEEFIFLLTALTASPRQFELAFKMFDLVRACMHACMHAAHLEGR